MDATSKGGYKVLTAVDSRLQQAAPSSSASIGEDDAPLSTVIAVPIQTLPTTLLPLELELDSHQATWSSCYINLTSTIVGAGVLGLPHAYALTGLLGGTFLLVGCALSSGFALHLLSRCAKQCAPPASFYAVAQRSLPRASALIDAAVSIKCFGVATSYLIVIGDLMPAVVDAIASSGGGGGGGLIGERSTWVVLGFCVAAPLSCLSALDSLKHTSLLSFFFVAMLIVVILLYAVPSVSSLDPCADVESAASDAACRGGRAWLVLDGGFVRSMPLFVFAYTCQQNLFTLVNELEHPTQQRIDSVVTASVGTACAVFLIAGVAGYATYGDAVASDLLKSYPARSAVTTVARLCVSAVVACHYPLQANPARKCLLTAWQGLTGGAAPAPDVYKARYITVTAVFLTASFLLAVAMDDLGILLGIVGASGSTVVSWILPGLFYCRMFQHGRGEADGGGGEEGHPPEPLWKVRTAWCQLAVGVALVPVCLTAILLNAVAR